MQRYLLAMGLAALAFLAGCDNTGGGSSLSTTGSSTQQGGGSGSGSGSGSGGGSGSQGGTSYAAAPIPVLVLDSRLPYGVYGQAYSYQLTAIGGAGGYTWSTVSTGAPGMFNLSSGGLLTVTSMPQSMFSTDITVAATDSLGDSGTRQYTFTANGAPPPPVYLQWGTTYLLNAGDEMATIDAGKSLSRFQRAAQDIMRGISEQEWWGGYEAYEMMVVVAGKGAATMLSQTPYATDVAGKADAINALAAVTPGGDAPMYSAAQLVQSADSLLAAPLHLCLYSGGAFGADSAAPGGQADYSNVLSQFSAWLPMATSYTSDAFDYLPSGAHQQFMQDFAAIAGGTYTVP